MHIADGVLVLVAIIWGGGFIAAQEALDQGILPILMVALRFTLASVVLSLILLPSRIKKKLKGEEIISWQLLKSGILSGIFLYLGFAFQTVGLQYVTPSVNAFLTTTNILFVPFLYWFISRKPISIITYPAILLAFVGISLLTLGQELRLTPGAWLSLLCALFFACHIVSLAIFSPQVKDVKLYALIQMATAMVLGWLTLLFIHEPIPSALSFNGYLALLYLGLFSTMICFLLQTVAQKYTTAVHSAIIVGSESLFGLLFSVLLNYEMFTIKTVIGGALIVITVVLIEIFD